MAKENKKEVSRRDLIRAGILAGAGAVAASTAVVTSRLSSPPKVPGGADTVKNIPEFKSIQIDGKSDVLIRMQEDLRRAMAKPVEKRKWLMVIDIKKCVGCHACTIACVAENKLPPGVVYRPVVTDEAGVYPDLTMRFFPRPCMQCENPSCVSVCPVRATWKRPDGVVAIDYDRCIGCRYCLSACPYGARTSDFGETYTGHTPEIQPYEKLANNEYKKSWDRADGSPVGNARKCHFCLHRLDEGLLPQCVVTCIGRANYFGDANDPRSLVSKKAKQSNAVKLLEEMGTKPTVKYLI